MSGYIVFALWAANRLDFSIGPKMGDLVCYHYVDSFFSLCFSRAVLHVSCKAAALVCRGRVTIPGEVIIVQKLLIETSHLLTINFDVTHVVELIIWYFNQIKFVICLYHIISLYFNKYKQIIIITII